MSFIRKILDIDRKFRYSGIEEDLFAINKLSSNKCQEYDLPTIFNKFYDPNKTMKLVNNETDFKNKFFKKFPFIKGFDLKNLLIAGGNVGNIIRNENINNDINFFVYGLSTDQAINRLEKWIKDLITCGQNYLFEQNSNQKKINIETQIEIIRNDKMIMIKMFGIKLKFIFRLYKTVSEILHSFDLGSIAVGFNGHNVYLTTLSKFCYENSCNIIDISRRSINYEYRLEKYFKRGFNIVLPDFDKYKLRTDYFKFKLVEVCELPYFIFSYLDIIGNKIIIDKFFNKYNKPDYNVEEIEKYNSFTLNLENLVNNNKNTTFHDKLRKIKPIYNFISKNFNIQIDNNEYLDNLIKKQTKFALEKYDKLMNQDYFKLNWIMDNPDTLPISFDPINIEEKQWYGKFYL